MSVPSPPCRPVLRGRRGAAPWLLLLSLLASCTGSGRALPDVDEFTSGTCRDAAPAVLALDEQVRRAAEPDADEAAARTSLREEQDRLRALDGGAGDVADALQEVVTRVGFARAALDVDALGTQDVTDVSAAVDRFTAVCVPADEK